MVVIYDTNGKIWYNGSGMGEPVGLPFLNVEIPEGHYLERIDVSGDTPTPVFVPYPKSEMELLQERVTELESQNKALVEGINLATGAKVESEV